MKLTWENLAAGAAAIVTLLLAWFVGIWLHLQGANLWILRIGILALGALCVVGIILWARSERASKAPHAPESSRAEPVGPDFAGADIDRLVREAESKVASSRLGHGAKLSGLPAFFVLGGTASAIRSSDLR